MSRHLTRFFLDALDAYRAVGEPRPEDFRAWIRAHGHEPAPEDMRACAGYIRGFRLGQLAVSASFMGAGLHGLGAAVLGTPILDGTYLVHIVGAVVFAIAAPHAFGTAWSWLVSTDDDSDSDDAGPSAPTARGA